MLNFLNSLLTSNAISSDTVTIFYALIGIVVVVVFVQFFGKVVTGKF